MKPIFYLWTVFHGFVLFLEVCTLYWLTQVNVLLWMTAMVLALLVKNPLSQCTNMWEIWENKEREKRVLQKIFRTSWRYFGHVQIRFYERSGELWSVPIAMGYFTLEDHVQASKTVVISSMMPKLNVFLFNSRKTLKNAQKYNKKVFLTHKLLISYYQTSK